MGLITRPATETDYKGICILYREADLLHSKAMPQIFQLSEGPARPKEYMLSILSDNNETFIVTEYSG